MLIRRSEISSTRRIVHLSFFTAVGISLFVFESFIPLPVPFLKIGLANISTILAITMFSSGDILLLVTVRVVVGSLLVGSLFGPGFILALAAGIVSAGVMAVGYRLFHSMFSLLGVSLLGSVAHVLTQFGLVMELYVQNSGMWLLLPVLLTGGIVSGSIIGVVSERLAHLLEATNPVRTA